MNKDKLIIQFKAVASYLGAVFFGVFITLFTMYACKGIVDFMLLFGVVLSAILAISAGCAVLQDKRYEEHDDTYGWHGK